MLTKKINKYTLGTNIKIISKEKDEKNKSRLFICFNLVV